MLEVKNLSCAYESNTYAIKNINFKVDKGELALLTGISGSGKSSIINSVNGINKKFYDKSVTGKVLYDGENLVDKEIYEISKVISTVFQNPKTHFFNVDTTRELLFFLENIGIKRIEMEERLNEMLKVFPIDHLLDRSIFELSGGEKQILSIAASYISGSDVIALDEPSSNLDEKYTLILKDMLRILKDKGKIIVVAEHRIYYLIDLVDRIYYLQNGEIKNEYQTNEFLELKDEDIKNMGIRSRVNELLDVKMINNDRKDLYVEELNYRFNKNKSIKVKDLALSYGKIYGIVGKNGVGKSTFIKSLIGLMKKSKEKIFVDGNKLDKKKRIKISALVMQDVNHQLFADSVINEVSLKIDASDEEKNHTLKKLSLLDYKERHPQNLSGGEKQRLAIATVLLQKRKIVCFDEATSGMDLKNMLEIANLIEKIKSKDNIVLLISHDTEFLNIVCDEIINIEDYSK